MYIENQQYENDLGFLWFLPMALSAAGKAGKAIARKKKRKKAAAAAAARSAETAAMARANQQRAILGPPIPQRFLQQKNKWILPVALGGAALIGVVLLTRK